MAVDPDLKAILTALAEGQTRNDTSIANLTEGQAHLIALKDTLTEQVGRSAGLINELAEGQVKLTDRVEKLTERLDGFTAAVLRGFTEGVGRDIATEKRVDQLEARMSQLENK